MASAEEVQAEWQGKGRPEALHKPITGHRRVVWLDLHFRAGKAAVGGRAEEREKSQCPESHTELQIPTVPKAKFISAVQCIF